MDQEICAITIAINWLQFSLQFSGASDPSTNNLRRCIFKFCFSSIREWKNIFVFFFFFFLYFTAF